MKETSSYVQDLRHGLRVAVTNRGFSLLLVATLVLGLGASTAVFSVVDAVLLQHPPYPRPDRIAFVAPTAPDGRRHFSPPDFIDFVESTSSFEALCAIQGNGLATMTAGGQSTPVQARDVTTNMLPVFGVQPVIGRGFNPADEDTFFTDRAAAARAPGAILIGHHLWLERFAGDVTLPGRIVQINFEPYEIIGVLPPGFDTLIPDEGDYRTRVDVWRLTRMNLRMMPRDSTFLRVVGRLKEDVTIAEADAEAGVFAARQRTAHALHRDGRYLVAVESLHASLTRRHGSAILLLFGAAGVLLTIACANLATLQLTRSVARQREFALRLALGASRGRLMRQLLVENALYGGVSAALALLVARWLTQAFVQAAPASIPRLDQAGVSLAAFVFAAALTLAVSALIALVLAMRVSRSRESTLLQSTRGWTGARRQAGERTFVVVQVALSVVLLIGTALVVRSVVSLLRVDPGFSAAHVLTADFYVTSSRYPRYPRADSRVRLARQLTDRVSSVPSVEAAALALVVPLSRQDAGHTFGTDAMAAANQPFPAAKYRPVTPGYFRAAGTDLLSGRDFDWHDLEQHRLVSIVDSGLAARAWPDEDPIGKRLRIERWSAEGGTVHLEPLWTEVVGVVEKVRSSTLRENDIETVYLPYSLYAVAELSLLVRSPSDPLALVESVRREAAAVDADLVLTMRSLDEVVADSLTPERFSLTLLGAFAVLGLSLSLIGLYGVLSQFVGLRRREIGVRMALGARRGDVRRGVLEAGARLIAGGVFVGAIAAAGLSGYLRSLVFEVSTVDGVVYAAVAGAVFLACLVACDVPARRASRIDPVETLRLE